MTPEPFDAVVIGTGFGGAVAACRLAQAGKTLCILERGRRYPLGDFPRPAKRPDSLPHTARWAWPIDQGLWDVKDLQGILAAVSAGYGGGSLVYANVHLRPPPQVFERSTGHEEDVVGWPAAYTRPALDPFYDVVAAALRVRPIPAKLASPAPAALTGRSLPKVDAMRRVATTLHRDQWLFLPPLAIDFDKCVMCAECVIGCQVHAKNTLDLNYLAVADAAAGVDVRTLAEVTSLKQEADGTYTVSYRDHVTGGSEAQVRGKSVFLCAGAVNSTDILLRSQDAVGMLDESKKQIGRRFFGNGDAISMTFDTASGAPPTPTAGPTIATTLLYNRQAGSLLATPHEWFVLQDGGYPKWLEPALGLFRGEFWLDRNRVVTGQPTAPRFDPDAAADVMRHAREMGQALLGLVDARNAFQTRSLTSTLGLADVLPRQIRDRLIPDLQQFAHDVEAGHAGPIANMTLDEVGDRIQAEHPFQGLLVPQAKKLARPYLLGSTLEILHQYFLKAPRDTREPFTPEILWPLLVGFAERLFLDRRPDDNALLMLGVGIDAAPGQLFLDDDGRLLASWDLAANIHFSSVQEQLMQDVAGALGGEMRLNPDFVSKQRPVTVHCLGGCAMADDSHDGVTNPDGKVWGTRALYVLDGAAIPTSLGTNPSSTIAAIAERNVRKALSDPQSPIFTSTEVPLDRGVPGWPPELTVAEIQRRLGQTPAILDPIRDTPSTPSPVPASPTVGFTFEEVMQGFYRRGVDVNLPIRAEFLATIDDLNAFLVNTQRPVTITGTVFLTRTPGAEAVPYDAKGTLALLRRVDTVIAVQKLFEDWLRRHGTSPATAGSVVASSAVVAKVVPDIGVAMDVLLKKLVKQAQRYEMRYDLTLSGPGGPFGFSGVKRIYGNRGLDVWTETTTLEVVLTDAGQAPFGTGKMRVHLADFLRRQLPSFTVTGTRLDDDARIAWALGRFFRFFFGTLRQVYLPQLETLNPFGDRTS